MAYEKTGQHAKAIETMLAKDKIKPGLYETYSNLGTFYILAGDFKQGLPYIDKALAINPDAHFGRERYQKWLVEYALSRMKDGKLKLPMRMDYETAKKADTAVNFCAFVADRLGGSSSFTVEESQKAIKGVSGMMRFANHDNPLLLEALGDLLSLGPLNHQPEIDAKRLAARASRASFAAKDNERRGLRHLAKDAVSMQTVHPATQSNSRG